MPARPTASESPSQQSKRLRSTASIGPWMAQRMLSRHGGVEVQHGQKLRFGLKGTTNAGETLPQS